MKEEINLVKIMEIIMRLWWLVLIFAIIGALVAYSISSFVMTPRYSATAKIYVNGSNANLGTDNDNVTLTMRRSIVPTYIEILCGNAFLEKVAEKSTYNIEAGTIKGNISMNAANETEIISIKYTDVSPKKAQSILRLLLNKSHEEIERVIPGCTVSIIDEATLPESPSSPDVKQNTFIGMFIGIVLGVAIIFIKELIDTRIKDEDDLKNRYSIPVLGVIPNLNKE